MDISAIEGEELTSVTFFQDYVQLDFNGSLLTLFSWPVAFVPAAAQMGEGSYAYREPGFRDALCLPIGDAVEAVTLEEGIALEIQFEDGVTFRAGLGEEDYVGSEAGHFKGADDDELVVF